MLPQLLALIEERAKPGPRGERGPQGPQGPEGPQGPQGLPGRDGEQGPRGPEGLRGPVGPKGLDGTNGSDGVNGSPGKDGKDGLQGEQGPPGPAGSDGEDGISVLKAEAVTLPPERPATARFYPESGLLRLGIPRGQQGRQGEAGRGGFLAGGSGGLSTDQVQALIDVHAALDVHDIPTFIQDTDPALPAPAKYLWVDTNTDFLWYNDGQVS